MIKFFRNIRKNLLSETQSVKASRTTRFTKYLFYEVGEIVLVVIGILIAVALNNRNEQKKNHENFLLELDIAFNRALLLNAQNTGYINIEKKEIKWIDSLLSHPESFEEEGLPVILHRLNSYSLPSLDELIDLKIKDEVFNKNDSERQLLINDINLFINRFSITEKTINRYWGSDHVFGDKLIEWGIPRITNADYSINNMDVDFGRNNPYTAHHYKIIKNKFDDQDFYDALIMLRSSKRSLVEVLSQISDQVLVFQERLAQYYPHVGTKVLSLGIIGSSLPFGWDQSVPLKYDSKQTQWTGLVHLEDGEVKFRANNNWGRNWGGNTFPKGELTGSGNNIAVEKGWYLVKVDLIENIYEFQKKEE